MKDLAFCQNWAGKLAARHPDDLSLSERTELDQHLSECAFCASTYALYNSMETRLRALPQAGPLPSLIGLLQQIKQNREPCSESTHPIQEKSIETGGKAVVRSSAHNL